MKTFLIAPFLVGDDFTKITLQWANRWKEKLAENISFCFLAEKAIRKPIISALSEDSGEAGVVLFLDHGSPNSLFGSDDKPFISSQREDLELLRNKFIISFACRTGANFGHLAVRLGASGFLGFNHDFVFYKSSQSVIENCLFLGVQYLLRGKGTASQARQVIVSAFNQNIRQQKFKYTGEEKKKLFFTLQHNRDFLIQLGDPHWKFLSQ